MSTLLVFGIFIALFVSFILLERRRQTKRYGNASGRPNLIGVGMLELQSMLQADRRVESLVRQQKKEEIALEERDENGDPPEA